VGDPYRHPLIQIRRQTDISTPLSRRGHGAAQQPEWGVDESGRQMAVQNTNYFTPLTPYEMGLSLISLFCQAAIINNIYSHPIMIYEEEWCEN
jgi:hypothetical protein